MEPTQKFLPEWAEACALSDDAFGAAYDGQSGAERAWMKKTTAQIYELFGSRRVQERALSTSWRQGFHSVQQTRPLEYAVAVFGPECCSGPEAVAAAMPVLMSGAKHCAALRVGDGADAEDAILAGMELCGMELVLSLSEEQAQDMLEHMQGLGRGAGIFLGAEDLCVSALKGGKMQVWNQPSAFRLGVFSGNGSSWDFESLKWAHPAAQIEVWKEGDGSAEDFLTESFDAVYVPEEMEKAARACQPLVLGERQEGTWIWPGIRPELFWAADFALRG